MEIGISIKQRLFQIAEIIHLRVFGHAMSDEMRKFLGNLSWSFFGGIIAAGIMFAVNILAGRWLGPEEYGRYNLIFLMAQTFFIPMVLGMDIAVVRSIAIANTNNERIGKIVSGSIFTIVGSISVTTILLFLGSSYVSDFFSVTSDMVFVAVLFAIPITLKSLFDGVARGLHIFRFQAIAKMFEAIIGVMIFLTAFLLLHNYISLIFSGVISAMFVSAIYMFKIRKFFSVFDFGVVLDLFRYAKFVIIGSIITLVLGYGDRYVVNRYLGIEELGLYSAYYTATILFVGQFIAIFSNAFFPMISKVGGKLEIMNKLDRLVFFGIAPVIIGVFIIGFFVLKIFGGAYDISLSILLLFGIVAALQFFVSFYAGMVNTHDERTYSWGLIFFAMRAIVYAVYIIVLIITDLVTVSAILTGLIVNYIVDMLNLRYIIKKYA